MSDAISDVHKYCAVYTAPEVAEGMLDRIGWTSKARLIDRVLLEPSCGDGSFLIPAIERLLASVKRLKSIDKARLANSIVAFEFDPATAAALHLRVIALLRDFGFSNSSAKAIAASWVRCEDFLLAKGLPLCSDVVGNPPYMRWSKVPNSLRRLYEENLPAYAARGDLCLAFICKAVALLKPIDSRMAFLSSDRWLRCSYGSRARSELAKVVRLAMHVDVHDAPVFLGARKVDAHAAISVLERGHDGSAVAKAASSLAELREILLTDEASPVGTSRVGLSGANSAVLAEHDVADVFHGICSAHGVLADAGVTIRCGLALGHSQAFVVEGGVDIEEDRLVPFVKTGDLLDDGRVISSSKLINVWRSDGTLIELSDYPKLARHLKKFRIELSRRACVKSSENWYRTIDRIDLDRLAAPKLLIAGMSKFARVALARGGLQPSNGIYSVASSEWPLDALFTVFRAGALDVFAFILAPRFSGNVKRFDGNILRQVRIPRWNDLSPNLKKRLLNKERTVSSLDSALVCEVYGISDLRLRRAIEKALSSA